MTDAGPEPRADSGACTEPGSVTLGTRQVNWNAALSAPPTIPSGHHDVVRARFAKELHGLSATGLTFLYICSGPRGTPFGVDTIIESIGGQVPMIDKENDIDQCDFAEDLVYERIMDSICSGAYAGGIVSPPCSTFVPARESRPGEPPGPGPLRGPEPPDI